jgi:hypothetical protein
MSRSNRQPKLSREWEEATPILHAVRGRRKKAAASLPAPTPLPTSYPANPFRVGGRVHTLFERLKSGKPVNKLVLFRGIETGNRSSLLQDLRRRAVIVNVDRNTSAYRLEQVGGIRIEQEPL